MEKVRKTDPSAFENPHSLANRLYRLVWNSVSLILRITPPKLCWPFRKWVLRLFGAQIGDSWLHSRVRIWAPSRLKVGDHSYIDAGVYLYNPWEIEIGDRVIISFDSLICTPSHDFRNSKMPLIGQPITMKNDIWVAAKAIVGPGIILGEGTVLGAGSVIFKNSEPWSVYAGNPAVRISKRTLQD